MKKKLNNLMPAQDKLKHLFVGFVFMLLMLILQSTFDFSVYWVVIAQLLLSFGGEVYDLFTEGEVEPLDVLFTALPLLYLIF